MGRRVVDANGHQPAVNGDLTADQQLPPWMGVDPAGVVVELTNQLAGMIQQLAMRDAYITQLHQALGQLTGTLPQENPAAPA